MYNKILVVVVISVFQTTIQLSGMIPFSFSDIQTNPFESNKEIYQPWNEVELDKEFTNNLISTSEKLINFVSQNDSLMNEFKQFVLLTKLNQLNNTQHEVKLHSDWQEVFNNLPCDIKNGLPDDIINECSLTDSEETEDYE